MDAERITTQVLYPSNALTIGLIREPSGGGPRHGIQPLAARLLRARAGRLKGVAVIAPQDPQRAVAEMEEAVYAAGDGGGDDADVRDALVDPRGPDFWPIYGAAERLGAPVAFHATAQVSVGNTRFHQYTGVHMVSHPFEQMVSIISVIANGVLDRFPRLRTAYLEAAVGRVPTGWTASTRSGIAAPPSGRARS